jgi:hypothetical protein
VLTNIFTNEQKAKNLLAVVVVNLALHHGYNMWNIGIYTPKTGLEI